MVEPSERAPVNIKGVREASWATAKRLSRQQTKTLGDVVSDAIDTYARIVDSGFGEPAEPLTPDQLTERMKAVAMLLRACAQMREATGSAHGKTVIMRAVRHLDARQVESEGVVATLNGRGHSVKTSPEIGKGTVELSVEPRP
jgi:hypothetical protein